jgi:hypothetical protein
MPVQTGTRLDRLQSLSRRTRHELASALRRGDQHEAGRLSDLDRRLTAAIWDAQPKVPAQRRAEPVVDRIAALGVTAKDVRTWALAVGLTKAQRGRLSMALVEAYAAAHPTTSKDSPLA